MFMLDTVILSALGFFAGIAFLASIWQSISEYNLTKKKRKQIKDAAN